MAVVTVDLPAQNLTTEPSFPATITGGSSALSTTDLGSFVDMNWTGGQNFRVGDGSPGSGFGLATIPEGAVVTSVHMVALGNRSGGGEADYNTSWEEDAETYPTAAYTYIGDPWPGNYNIGPLPEGEPGWADSVIPPTQWQYVVANYAAPGFGGLSPAFFVGPSDAGPFPRPSLSVRLYYLALRVTYETPEEPPANPCVRTPVPHEYGSYSGGASDPTDDWNALTDEDPETAASMPSGSRYSWLFNGTPDPETTAGFRVEATATGSGVLRWEMGFDDPTASPYSIFYAMGTITIDGDTTYEHRLTIDDLVPSIPHPDYPSPAVGAQPSDSAELTAWVIARVGVDAGFNTGYGTLRVLSGDVSVSRFGLVGFTVGCLKRLGIPPLRQIARSDARGAASALRVAGPSRSIQGSLRQAGGTFI